MTEAQPSTPAAASGGVRLRRRYGRCLVDAASAPESPDLAEWWLDALMDTPEPRRKILKDDHRTTVWLVYGTDCTWILKAYHLAPLKSMAYRLIGCTPGRREWRGGRRLRDLGIRVAAPVALVHPPAHEMTDILVVPYVAGCDLASWLTRRSSGRRPSLRRRMARRIGEQAGRLLAAGLVNRDHKAPNLLVDAACEEGRLPPVLIDASGLRRRTARRQWRMLALLWWTATEEGGRVAPREAMAVLRTAVRTDARIRGVRPMPLREALAAVQAATISRFGRLPRMAGPEGGAEPAAATAGPDAPEPGSG